MERWEATLEMATKLVDLSKNQDVYTKIQSIGTAIENILKSILMKANCFKDNSFRGDKHHKCFILYEKIKNNECLDRHVIQKIEQILIKDRLIYMDQKLLNCDTTAGYYPNIRYPIKVNGTWISIVEELNEEVLQEKHKLLIKLLYIIKKNL